MLLIFFCVCFLRFCDFSVANSKGEPTEAISFLAISPARETMKTKTYLSSCPSPCLEMLLLLLLLLLVSLLSAPLMTQSALSPSGCPPAFLMAIAKRGSSKQKKQRQPFLSAGVGDGGGRRSKNSFFFFSFVVFLLRNSVAFLLLLSATAALMRWFLWYFVCVVT